MATDKEGVKSMIDIMVDYRKGSEPRYCNESTRVCNRLRPRYMRKDVEKFQT